MFHTCFKCLSISELFTKCNNLKIDTSVLLNTTPMHEGNLRQEMSTEQLKCLSSFATTSTR